MNNIRARGATVFLAFLLTLLSACGGGGGGAPAIPGGAALSGTASAGAPIIGTVTVKDSSTPFRLRTVDIMADGTYRVDVTGMTPPFMLRAEGRVGGRSYTLHSAAVSSDVNGTINVTPLTDLIVANIAGQIAGDFFAAGNFAALTPAELNAQQQLLRTRLQPILAAAGVGDAVDLLRASFNADHTGLDAALDALRISVDPATAQATILNIIDNQQIIDDLASRSDNSVIAASGNVAVGLGELQQIVARFDALSALFANGLPASNNAALLDLFEPTFLHDGETRGQLLSELTTDPQLVGVRFTNVALVPMSLAPAAAPTTAKVVFTVVFADGWSPADGAIAFTLNKVAGVWRADGNRRIAYTGVRSFAHRQDRFLQGVLQTGAIESGLRFEIEAPTAAGLADIGATLPFGAGYYAVVTGPGLPASGAVYVHDLTSPWSDFHAAAGSTYTGPMMPRLTNFFHDEYPLDDQALGAIADNASYTIRILHDNATPNTVADDVLLATVADSPGKRPYLRSELASGSFATITAPDGIALESFASAGGSLDVAWTLPASGAASHAISFFRNGNAGGDDDDATLLPTQTRASLSLLPAAVAGIGIVQSYGIDLHLLDAFGRERVTALRGN